MKLRFKTYILFLVLTLIVVLIASMYLELIANVIDNNRSVESVESGPVLSGNGNGEANFQSDPVNRFSIFTKDTFSSGLSYPPPQAADVNMYPYPTMPAAP